jgi:8-oxo-dGTP pyrophosphatase MutT (NUDIX family)
MEKSRILSILSQHTPASLEWKGAVLFLCNESDVVLIKRSETMPTHSGQLAFVGGHRRPDENNPWQVAIREFEEETSLQKSHVEFMGYLPAVMTARFQLIIPVLGFLHLEINQFLQQVKSNGEWEELIVYPWKELIQESQWEYAWRHGYSKSAVMFHPIRSGTYRPVENNVKPHLLWGATAQMIWHFLQLYYQKENHG